MLEIQLTGTKRDSFFVDVLFDVDLYSRFRMVAWILFEPLIFRLNCFNTFIKNYNKSLVIVSEMTF